MRIRNIIIITVSVLFTAFAVVFFTVNRKEQGSPPAVSPQDAQEQVPAREAPKPVVTIFEPEDIPKQEETHISAADYSNFEKTIDKLIELTGGDY